MAFWKNIAITGAKQAGKSTLAHRLLAAGGLPYAGFRTTVYARTALGPLYRLTDVRTGETAPISHLTEEGIRGIPRAFEETGVRCLQGALTSDAPLVLLDEIGRFERQSPAFLQSLWAALDSDKRVIAVLKKEELAHIAAICARKDTLVVDLDELGREQSRLLADEWAASIEKTDDPGFDFCAVP